MREKVREFSRNSSMFECSRCSKSFASSKGLNIHTIKTHYNRRTLVYSPHPSPERSISPIDFGGPFEQDIFNPLHRFDNDFVYIRNNAEGPNNAQNNPNAEEDYAPFHTKRELDQVHFLLKANVSRTNITQYFQLHKDNPAYSSRNMNQIALKIKDIPLHHPEMNSGEWVSETFGKLCEIMCIHQSNHIHIMSIFTLSKW